MMRILLAAAVLVGVGSGCVVHGRGGHHRVYGPSIQIEAGHVHSDHCGHYSHGSSWYVKHDHRHGPGCGHAHRGGVWVVVH